MKRFIKQCTIFIVIFGILSTIVFSTEEAQNTYAYWVKFKPGTFVSFRCKSLIGGVTKETLKTISLKKVSPDWVFIEWKEVAVGGKETDTREPIFWPFFSDTPPWVDNDIYGGYLGVNANRIIRDIFAEKIDESVEEIEIGGIRLKAKRIKTQFVENKTKTTISLWLSEKIPGKVAKILRNIQGTTSVTEEIVATDFKTIKASPSSLEYVWIEKMDTEPGLSFVWDNLRFFDETKLIMRESKNIKKEFKNIDPEDINYSIKTSEKLESLVKMAQDLKTHFQEDLKKIEKELNKNEVKKIESFLKQASIFCDVYTDFFVRIFDFVSNMLLAPAELTPVLMLEYEELDKIQEEFPMERRKLGVELEKLKKITIHYKIKRKQLKLKKGAKIAINNWL